MNVTLIHYPGARRSASPQGTAPDLGQHPQLLLLPHPHTCHCFWADTATGHILLWWRQSEIRVWLSPGDPQGMGWASPAGAPAALAHPALPPAPSLNLDVPRAGFGSGQSCLGPAVWLSGPAAQHPWLLCILPWPSFWSRGLCPCLVTSALLRGHPLLTSLLPTLHPTGHGDATCGHCGLLSPRPSLPSFPLSPDSTYWSFSFHLECINVGALGWGCFYHLPR